MAGARLGSHAIVAEDRTWAEGLTPHRRAGDHRAAVMRAAGQPRPVCVRGVLRVVTRHQPETGESLLERRQTRATAENSARKIKDERLSGVIEVREPAAPPHTGYRIERLK